ncbi:hypothetical protein A2686_05055 [Candidatus Woesebacteria bacterium RIFCSPHIGHO2_01_FULL_38_10]|uniref:N(4)-bis(aminopropyl)spermidine synthase C-terminal domain-containing protein n=1 Tax=Candidatus Woesebacteria bacterium RIFCSPLOWO2_01_FULL_39_10b TaxID=1802517 RepID=A0A1F8B620_9BACT|nr:MAG: hypothetical protein A2686_05055 [Candidatus Woesebacteria bacterium RIFCSPHIGHO2_01_FULL_38_10]OGM59492.1 MAG: hypothetical protein A2892_02495 [Candidatus Woesebacteria bacterium RIFCSPLOWO2_01_FULL_39_10b]
MANNKIDYEKIIQISKEIGVSSKKVLDFLFMLRDGEPIGNNELLRRIGVSKNALNQAKEFLSSFLKPPSKDTQLKEGLSQDVNSLFDPGYRQEEDFWSVLENEHYRKSVELFNKYASQRPTPERKYDQFTATIETTARRASLLNFFEDVRGKEMLFLGDGDFTSVAVANLYTALEVAVLDIDGRILDEIGSISKIEKLGISSDNYDARKPLPAPYFGKFDVVFSDPPYTTDGIKLFVSRAIQALDPSNQTARIYVCYGNSDRAKEKFLPVNEIFSNSGLMVRWLFDKFNRYQGAESIGSASSLFILEVTSKTKPLITGKYDKPIYTND